MAENAKVSKMGNLRRNFVRFFKEIRAELKKVVWLTRKQVINNTVTVLMASLITGIVIWTADALLGYLLMLIVIK